MKTLPELRIALFSFFMCSAILCACLQSSAQTPGLIVRPPGGAGLTPLNPNGDGFTSPTALTKQVYKGENSIPLNNLSGKLAKGIYVVSAAINGQILTTKFLL